MRKFTVDEVGTYLANGFWNSNGGVKPPNLGETISVDLSTLTAANQRLARLALEAWSDTGLSFSFTNGNADILLIDDRPGGATRWDRFGYIPDHGYGYRPTVNVGPDFTRAYGSDFGDYTYQSWLHEIGHALGLGHAGNYNGTGTYGVDNLFSNDSWQMTVMSYFPQDENSAINASFAYVLTPMPGDIAGIAKLYDTSNIPGEGDTVYFWGTNAKGIHGQIGRQIASGALDTPFTLTIMDQGGVDTLNFRGDSRGVNISLDPNATSSAFGLRGNILIERQSVIENVIGTSGNDHIKGQWVGNQLRGGAGNDRLDGYGGHDTLFGDAGDDKLFAATGNDRLTGGAGRDLLDGGTGSDTAVYTGGAVSVDLLLPARNRGDAAVDRLVSIENVAGGNFNDRLSGGNDANRLIGNGGHDVIDGRWGNDILEGRAGNDTLFGGAGNDHVVAGAGDDRIVVNGGRDLVIGGAGADEFVFTGGQAVIVDFADSLDELQIARTAMGNPALTVAALIDSVQLSGHDMVLDLGGGREIRLKGISNPDILADDLILV